MSLSQYIKDTRGELHHVAWPTRTQTTVYTALVIGISVVVSLYLGVFDYLFTNALGVILERSPKIESQIQLPDVTDTIVSTTTNLIPGFNADEPVAPTE